MSNKEEFECRMFPDELREAQRRAFPPDAFHIDSRRRKFINEAAIAVYGGLAACPDVQVSEAYAYSRAVALWEHIEQEETKHELKEYAKNRAAAHAAEIFYSKEPLPETGL